MTFLQPALLFALPFILVPVLVHLLNKRRHRTYAWAAMMFLVRATQQARGRRKLRHFLILACRVLAVAALIFALSRPLAGGWVSWFGGNRPEAILLLLDRSASMESAPSENTPTKRSAAISRVASAVKELAGGARVVFFDSAGTLPLEMASADALADLPQAAPTGTAADIPALLEKAIDYLTTAKPGRAEIWLASDLQESNWLPNDGRWQTIRASLRGLNQTPPVRILGLTGEPASSHALRLVNVLREGPNLLLDIEIQRLGDGPTALPLTVALDGAAGIEETIDVPQSPLAMRKRLSLGQRTEGGWGRLGLGPDLNTTDNIVWFAFGGQTPLQSAVVSADFAGKVLALASAPPGSNARQSSVFAPENAHNIAWQQTRLILWQAPLPSGALAAQLEKFVESGGSVIFFPSGHESAPDEAIFGQHWSAPEAAAADARFSILSWETMGGPLAHFRDGHPMGLDKLFIIKRQLPTGEASVIATYDDGSPAATRLASGLGQAVFFSTLPDPRWSDLESSNILLPLIERLLAASARFAVEAPTLSLGDAPPSVPGQTGAWECLDGFLRDGTVAAAPSVHPGIYRRGTSLAAFNVPASEFQPAVIDRARLEKLFDGIGMRLFEERVTREQGLATEIWRSFALFVLFLLLAEALLCLPQARAQSTSAAASNAPDPGLPRTAP